MNHSADIVIERSDPGIYLKFLSQSYQMEVADPIDPLKPLDPLEQRILMYMAYALHSGSEVLITDVVSLDSLASVPTMYRRLKSMIKKGWVRVERIQRTRSKRIVLTDHALEYFSHLSAALVRSGFINPAA